VRRRQATVRTIFSQEERLLIVLIDYSRPGEFPDGEVDWAYNFYNVEGSWPLPARWEALTHTFQYDSDPSLPRGFAFTTPQGPVQLRSFRNDVAEPDPSALAVLSFRGASGSVRRGMSFTEVEALQFEDYARSKASGATVSTTMGAQAGPGGTGSASATLGTATLTGAIRGPNVAPRQIRDVAPQYPEAARQANVSGIVVLQLTVGVDGTVTDAHVLRSIPLLDAAAIDAAKQWQYEPRERGNPVTVTVAVPVTP
jgi:TonB family protein